MEDTVQIKKPKLLLADDSVTVRKVIELTFAEEGVDVFAVGDGEAAMKKFVEIEPDIVLADVNMPEPTGYHICEMIKQDETTRDIPVLLLVGTFEPFDQTEAERVGADGFLTKPFQSVRELVGRVTELLNGGMGMSVTPADTADIQSLFESSFAESYRAENEVRSNTVLGDAGMDDDLIETVYREGGPKPETAMVTEDIREHEMQGYDWMSQPAVEMSEPVSVNGDRSVDEPEFESIVNEFDDTRDIREPDRGSQQERQVEMAAETQPEMHSYQSHDVSDEVTEVPTAYQPSDVERTTIHERPTEQYPSQVEDVGADPSFHHEIEQPAQDEGAPEPAAVSAADELSRLDVQSTQFSAEPSEELVNAIAQRVVEKLSDKAVREIALEAVPRIAEKLIREALDPENKRQSNS